MQPDPSVLQSCLIRRKKAVICGISYKGRDEELAGCINDAKFMKYLLTTKFNFSNIIMLTEEEKNSMKIPTKRNIINAMLWLVQDCRPGDSLVFYYSGHGSQQKDKNGDEIDGFDETICPLDFDTNGMITDDEINHTIVRPLPSGVKLHAIIDSCHSGTMLDLPYLCKMNRNGHCHWEDHRPRTGAWKGTGGGEVFSFSGCDDHQVSADTKDLSKTTATGAMTYSFIKALESGDVKTYGGLLNFMQSAIIDFEKKMYKKGGSLVKLFGKLERFLGKNQVPQLTSNQKFDVYNKPFSL